MRTNPLTQKVNFLISATFIASFGLFCAFKIIDALHVMNPIREAVVSTQEAILEN